MTATRKKLAEAQHFLVTTHQLFNNQSLDFEFHLNAFINASRNVTFVMQKEYSCADGFKAWWDTHPSKKDSNMTKFVHLRNVSVKEKSIGHQLFSIRHDFGPEGLRVVGHNGPTSVKSDIISFNGPIPDHTYVTVNDDNGERRVKVKLIHDFSVVESYDHGTKTVKFDSFISEAQDYLVKLTGLVDECETKFGASTPLTT